jgi:VanZ family protein
VIDLKQARLIARLVGLLAVLAIAILSLVPGDMRPQTGMPKQLEHIVAYLLTAAVLAFGYGKRRYPIFIILSLAIYSAALEVAQTQIPGRTGSFGDFVVSFSGALIGGTLAWLVLRAFPHDFA